MYVYVYTYIYHYFGSYVLLKYSRLKHLLCIYIYIHSTYRYVRVCVQVFRHVGTDEYLMSELTCIYICAYICI